MLGCGSIGQAILPLIFKHLAIKPKQLSIIEADNRGAKVTKKYGVKHVYLEGGEGALAISRLNENVLEKKLNLGEISGAEFTAATNKNSTEYYGI